MKKGKIVAMDTATGEILEQVPVVFPTKHRNGFEEFGMTNLAMCARMSEDRDFTGEVYRVYNQLLGRLEWQNYIMVCQTDIAKALKMRPQNVNRAIKTLVRKGVVIEGKKVERHWTYRLNPNYMWRGEAKSHKDALLEQHNWSVIQGGKKTDAELRAEMEAKGQQRMEFEDGF